MRSLTRAAIVAAIAVALVAPAVAQAQATTYRVTVTNLTQHQVLSPAVVATHAPGTAIFHAGESVDMPFWLMAEDGEPDELAAKLEADPWSVTWRWPPSSSCRATRSP